MIGAGKLKNNVTRLISNVFFNIGQKLGDVKNDRK